MKIFLLCTAFDLINLIPIIALRGVKMICNYRDCKVKAIWKHTAGNGGVLYFCDKHFWLNVATFKIGFFSRSVKID